MNIGDKLLPIGSVVILKNFNKKLMIIGYKSSIIGKPEMKFDYSACFYPDGFVSAEQSILFDHKQIEQVIFTGMTDEKANFNVEVPKAETPAVAPVAETTAEAPVAEPVVETSVEVPAAEPVVETPAEVPAAEPVVETTVEAPAAEPVVEAPVEAPAAEPVVEAPVEVPAAEPVVEAPVEVPAAEPVVEAPVEVPAVESVVEAPVEVPAVESVVEAPVEVPAAEPVVETPVEVPAAEPVVETPVEVPAAEPVVESPVVSIPTVSNDNIPVLDDDDVESDGPSFDVTPISNISNPINNIETPIVEETISVPTVELPPVVEVKNDVSNEIIENNLAVPNIEVPTSNVESSVREENTSEVVLPSFDLSMPVLDVAPTEVSNVAPVENSTIKSNDAASIFMTTPNNVQTPSELPVSLNPSIDFGLSVVADNKKEETTLQPKITGISDLMAGASDFVVSGSSSNPANVNDIFPKSKFLGGFDSQTDNSSNISNSFL